MSGQPVVGHSGGRETGGPPAGSFNEFAAGIFIDCADMLRLQIANPFRINAYARAAQTLGSLSIDVRDILGKESAEGIMKLPGIGPSLARKIHETLHVDTLEALEVAAHDGRLDDVPGIGSRRAAAIRASLAEVLGPRPALFEQPRAAHFEGVRTARLLAGKANVLAVGTPGRP